MSNRHRRHEIEREIVEHYNQLSYIRRVERLGEECKDFYKILDFLNATYIPAFKDIPKVSIELTKFLGNLNEYKK